MVAALCKRLLDHTKSRTYQGLKESIKLHDEVSVIYYQEPFGHNIHCSQVLEVMPFMKEFDSPQGSPMKNWLLNIMIAKSLNKLRKNV